MSDVRHLPTPFGNADVQVFLGSASASGQQWITWTKPRGKSMVDILLIGKGGNGGLGQVAAAGACGGGGGGGSGGQTQVRMPLHLLPDYLSISLAATVTGDAYIALGPKLTAGAGVPAANDLLVWAAGGQNGQDGAAGGGGGGGAGGSIATAAAMPLGWSFARALAGQAGQAGGGAAAGLPTDVTLPVTGLLVTGAPGGAGVPSAGAGILGGSLVVAGRFRPHVGGAGGATTTTPPDDGAGGYYPIPGLRYGYGGAGGGSTHATATGAGLYASRGGNGAPGCGGGGCGGALTGTTPNTAAALGGAALCIITCW